MYPECPTCLCALLILPAESTAKTQVWQCPGCKHCFIPQPDQILRPYYRGPFIGPMYGLIFEQNPLECVVSAAEQFLTVANRDEVEFMILSCEAELKSPSCRLSEVYDFQFKLTEASLREFLRLFVQQLKLS